MVYTIISLTVTLTVLQTQVEIHCARIHVLSPLYFTVICKPYIKINTISMTVSTTQGFPLLELAMLRLNTCMSGHNIYCAIHVYYLSRQGISVAYRAMLYIVQDMLDIMYVSPFSYRILFYHKSICYYDCTISVDQLLYVIDILCIISRPDRLHRREDQLHRLVDVIRRSDSDHLNLHGYEGYDFEHILQILEDQLSLRNMRTDTVDNSSGNSSNSSSRHNETAQGAPPPSPHASPPPILRDWPHKDRQPGESTGSNNVPHNISSSAHRVKRDTGSGDDDTRTSRLYSESRYSGSDKSVDKGHPDEHSRTPEQTVYPSESPDGSVVIDCSACVANNVFHSSGGRYQHVETEEHDTLHEVAHGLHFASIAILGFLVIEVSYSNTRIPCNRD